MSIMKNRMLLVFIILMYSLCFSAQNNYTELLVNDTRTFWTRTQFVCNPQWNVVQVGIYFDSDGLFDWYKITDDNDTLSLYEGIDTEIYISHRSYELCGDTLFIYDWYNEYGGFECDTSQAYKILYLTKQKLVLVEQKKDTSSMWRDYLMPPCNELNILEFNRSNKSKKPSITNKTTTPIYTTND